MFDADIIQYLSPEFIFGFVGGILAVAFLTMPLKSFVADKMGRALKQWESVGCALVVAFVVSLAWGLRAGGITWNEIPGNVLVYVALSGFVYENVIKPWIEKKKSGNGGG